MAFVSPAHADVHIARGPDRSKGRRSSSCADRVGRHALASASIRAAGSGPVSFLRRGDEVVGHRARQAGTARCRSSCWARSEQGGMWFPVRTPSL